MLHSFPTRRSSDLLDEHISIDIQWSAQQLDIYLYASPTRAQKLKPLTPQLEKRLSNINPNPSIHWRDQPFELALEKDTQPHANMTKTTRTQIGRAHV